MKKWLKMILTCALFFTMSACVNKEEFEEIPTTMAEVQTMLDGQEDFILLVERENCPFCEKLHDYINETKREHNDTKVYVLDTTNYKFKKETPESKTLMADTEEGTLFLESFPYFMYTPSIYIISSGEAVSVASGFDAITKEVSVWDVDSVIDFDKANNKNVWQYMEEV